MASISNSLPIHSLLNTAQAGSQLAAAAGLPSVKLQATPAVTVQISSAAKPDAMNVTDALSNGYVSDGGAAVTDSVSNIQANLDDLQTSVADGTVKSINFTGSGKPMLMVTAGHVADDVFFGMISKATLKFSDTMPTDVTVSAKTALALEKKRVAGETVNLGAINISDTADNIQAMTTSLAGMQAKQHGGVSNLGTVNIVDDGSNAVVLLNAKQAAQADQAGVTLASKLAAGGGSVVVRDTAANVLANANGLSTAVAEVDVVDTAANVNARIGQLAAIANLNSIEVKGSGVVNLSLAQATNNGAAMVDAINNSASHATIQVTDSVANLTAANASADLEALNEGGVGFVRVKDSAANIQGSLDALHDLASAGQLQAVSLTGTSKLVQVSADQAINESDVVTLVMKAGGKTQLMDTAQNISANLDRLQTLVSSKQLSNTAAMVTDNKAVSFTTEQYTKDAGLRGMLKSAGVSLQLPTVNGMRQVLGAYGADVTKVVGGAGDNDAYFAKSTKVAAFVGSAGRDTLKLEGTASNWTIRKSTGGGAFGGAALSGADLLTELNSLDAKASYEFTNTANGGGAVVTATRAESVQFYDPKKEKPAAGSISLKA